jgi:hypothetical protein
MIKINLFSPNINLNINRELRMVLFSGYLIYIIYILFLTRPIEIINIDKTQIASQKNKSKLLIDTKRSYIMLVLDLTQHAKRIITLHYIYSSFNITCEYSLILLIHHHLQYFICKIFFFHLIILFIISRFV